MPEQQQETLNWGIDIDVSEDSDESMSGQASRSHTVTFALVGSGATGGGAPGGGGPPAGGGGGGGGGSPPGGGGHGLPAAPPTLDNLNWLMADLGNVVGVLAQQVLDITCDQARGHGGAKDLISKPKPWDGKGGSNEARHFLAAFHNFMASQGSPLNAYNTTTNAWTVNEEQWIQSILNLMEGDTHTWALPYLEELRNGTIPFGGLWATFLDHFTRRFAPLDTAGAV
jgi:hypothetical protein